MRKRPPNLSKLRYSGRDNKYNPTEPIPWHIRPNEGGAMNVGANQNKRDKPSKADMKRIRKEYRRQRKLLE